MQVIPAWSQPVWWLAFGSGGVAGFGSVVSLQCSDDPSSRDLVGDVMRQHRRKTWRRLGT